MSSILMPASWKSCLSAGSRPTCSTSECNGSPAWRAIPVSHRIIGEAMRFGSFELSEDGSRSGIHDRGLATHIWAPDLPKFAFGYSVVLKLPVQNAGAYYSIERHAACRCPSAGLRRWHQPPHPRARCSPHRRFGRDSPKSLPAASSSLATHISFPPVPTFMKSPSFMARKPSVFAHMGQRLMKAVADFPAPTIAAVHGYCMGGGLDLALACRIASLVLTRSFGHRGAALGLITGWGGTQRLPRLVGRARALQMFLAAEKLHAAKALRSGLVDAIAENPSIARISIIGLTSSIGPIASHPKQRPCAMLSGANAPPRPRQDAGSDPRRRTARYTVAQWRMADVQARLHPMLHRRFRHRSARCTALARRVSQISTPPTQRAARVRQRARESWAAAGPEFPGEPHRRTGR